MTANTAQKKEGFYDRMKRLKNETGELQNQAFDRIIELTKEFDKASAPAQKKITRQLASLDIENRRLREQYRELTEQERNPPWSELSEQLFSANYAKVEELTRDGKMIKLMNKERVPVLGQPAYAGDEKIAELLIARGADVNIPGHDNLTPLLLSVMKDNAGIFKKLLEAGADINARTKQGDGVRDLARFNDATEVRKVLRSLDRKAKKPATAKPK